MGKYQLGFNPRVGGWVSLEPVSGFFSLETLAIIAVFIFLVSYTVLYRQNRLLLQDNDRFIESRNALDRLSGVFIYHNRFEDAAKALAEELQEHMKADVAGLYLSHQNGKTVHLAAVHGLKATTAQELRYLTQDEAFIGQIFANRQPVFEPDLVSKPRLTSSAMKRDEWASLCAVPIIYRDELIGVVFTVRKGQPFFSEEHRRFMANVGNVIGAPIKAAIVEAALKRHVVRDKLTGLYTKDAFTRYLKTEIMRCERFARMVSVVVVEIQAFEEFRQICGETSVNKAFRDIGRLMNSNTRAFDLACRYGDSQFAILLPETDNEGAEIVADRIRNEIAKAVFDNGEGDRVIKLATMASVAAYPFILSQPKTSRASKRSDALVLAALEELRDSRPANRRTSTLV